MPSTTSTAPPEAADLTPSQRARRERILNAAADLASGGGWDAVQMRDVSETADVALGTLYRYFPSKVHLLVATMNQQTEAMRSGIRRRPAVGETSHERVVNVMRRASRAMERDPALTGAMLRAVMFADASAASEVSSVNSVLTELLTWAIIGDESRESTAEERAIARVLQQVWLTSLMSWLVGRSSPTDMHENIETASRLLLTER